MTRVGITLLWIGAAQLAFAAAPSSEEIKFFEQKVRPVLVEHCYECHSGQAKKLKGGLLLDSRGGWQRGGDSGKPAITPGDPNQSPLIRSIQHLDADLQMPPKKAKLPDSIIADLVAWVKMGAPDPRDGTTEARRADKSWWSLQPFQESELPAPRGLPKDWASNPIDRFVYSKLAEKRLRPNPPADRRALIRRIYYDLTGLPPTPEEVEAFINDRDPKAYEKLVGRLLDSPQYGERWGRHWLDVVRFGESNGFERNFIIDSAWPFRDYVIRSLNEDKPFNRFILEHLAGDVIGKDQPDVEVGVAFLTIGPYDDVGNQDPVARANIRAATVDDMVTAAGSAFLGLTINCARCHHHKFDPVPTEDYYRLKAAFDGVTHGERTLATREERERFQAAVGPLNEQKAKLTRERTAIEKAILERANATPQPPTPRTVPSARLTEERFPAVEAVSVRFTILATSENVRSGSNARVDEFEVWSTGENPKNVALSANGATVQGAAGRVAKDFDGAYGPELTMDGKFGAAWIVGNPSVMTITFPRVETVNRVSFSYDRISMSEKPIPGRGPSVTEYEIHVSTDGKEWRKVADSFDRAAYSPAHAEERRIRNVTTAEDRKDLGELSRRIASVESEIRKVPPLKNFWVAQFEQPKARTVVFRGGDPMKPGDEVKPASLEVLDRISKKFELPVEAPESERRLALAKWIVDDENALTARVLANRVWQHHFGVGIVDTPSDFGFLGSRPTHPELLDWLARRLQEHGWKLKPLHRDIVLSQAYRQASAYREDGGRLDKDARLLWRFPPRRLEAEEMRDTLLRVAGKLDARMGGPGFRLYSHHADNVSTYTPLDTAGPETYRRAVYHQNVRASVVDLLSDFDLPDNAFPAPKRSSTTTPMQALTLLNHNFALDMAKFLAERLSTEAESSVASQVKRAYALAFQRAPSAREQTAAAALIQAHGLNAFCRGLLNANELFYLE